MGKSEDQHVYNWILRKRGEREHKQQYLKRSRARIFKIRYRHQLRIIKFNESQQKGKRPTHRHIIDKLKTKDNGIILKTARKKKTNYI